jgi:hypothetical protein
MVFGRFRFPPLQGLRKQLTISMARLAHTRHYSHLSFGFASLRTETYTALSLVIRCYQSPGVVSTRPKP